MKPEELADLGPARLPFPVTRALAATVETRAADGGMPTMSGHFSTFNDWYEVHSVFEGHFLERVAPGAFKKTIRESRGSMKVLYDHGQDPSIGNKILGPIDQLREDAVGPYFEVPLFDTSYNRDLVPGLEAGVYGTSFRFSVEKDTWDQSPERSDYNPNGLPERTITEIRNHEFGPVTFPANDKADIGVRSTTDSFYQRSRDPEQFDSLLRSAQYARTPAPVTVASPPDMVVTVVGGDARAEAATPEPPVDTPSGEPSSSDTPPAEPPPTEAAVQPTKTRRTGGSLHVRKEPRVSEYNTREDMASRATELEAALERTGTEYPGRLPDDVQVSYDADKRELEELQADIAAWDGRQADLKRLVGRSENVEPTYAVPVNRNQINRKNESDIYSFERGGFRTLEERDQEWRDDAMRAVEIARYATIADKSATQDKLADLLDHGDSADKELARRIKATGSPTYRRAFDKIIKGRGTNGLTPEEQRGTALAVGVDGTGGFAVPFAFDPTVIAIGVNNGAVNPYRRACRVVTIVGTDTWNALTATAVTATRTTEAAAAIEQGPTFAQPQYIVKRVQGQITASYEMFQDRADLASELSGLIQEAKDNEEETSWATGAGGGSASIGVGPVNGTSGAYTSITTAGSVTLAAADADATEAALPVRHRFGAQWFLNRLSIRRFQTLETAGGKLFGGQQYQAVGIPELDRAGNTGLRLLGYPVNESPSLPTAQTANIVIGTLLNPQSFVIVDRVGLSVQFIPWLINSSALATGQAAIYFLYRNHAAPINVDAGRTLRYLT